LNPKNIRELLESISKDEEQNNQNSENLNVMTNFEDYNINDYDYSYRVRKSDILNDSDINDNYENYLSSYESNANEEDDDENINKNGDTHGLFSQSHSTRGI
jgi:hypothetical protein